MSDDGQKSPLDNVIENHTLLSNKKKYLNVGSCLGTLTLLGCYVVRPGAPKRVHPLSFSAKKIFLKNIKIEIIT